MIISLNKLFSFFLYSIYFFQKIKLAFKHIEKVCIDEDFIILGGADIADEEYKKILEIPSNTSILLLGYNSYSNLKQLGLDHGRVKIVLQMPWHIPIDKNEHYKKLNNITKLFFNAKYLITDKDLKISNIKFIKVHKSSTSLASSLFHLCAKGENKIYLFGVDYRRVIYYNSYPPFNLLEFRLLYLMLNSIEIRSQLKRFKYIVCYNKNFLFKSLLDENDN